MKKYIYIAIAGILLLFSACEKEIQLDLNSANTKYVIEGMVTDQPGPAVVVITQTKDFSSDNNFPGVGGAAVTISDNNGPEITLNEITAGHYESSAVTGVPGHSYALKVVVSGQTFTAISSIPAIVKFDSLYVSSEVLMGDDRKVANVMYKDPPERGNSFHYIQYVNNRRTRSLFAENDNLTNGRNVTTQLRVYGDEGEDHPIVTGDSIRVEMQGIDPGVYLYWFSLQSASGRSNDGAPANPVTNIKGGALGYFSAHNVQVKTVTVP
ncbi:DUF4249 domain-containing protein [Mucilaginibacter sp. KACC 22773]|uniref:DUF4249 domain-containing protein n=1 Tax=Mucilaginibacter sp. KACC 22773 TaxID=3025671 RepID=UPI0023652721|nr:DUF4249 domain-containing protein [Mucilaginibacter sp. KACC 22773]WDF77108.1 DUF4249 domain-containing protein [Mucilaginibacter sp. KACC 22773]